MQLKSKNSPPGRGRVLKGDPGTEPREGVSSEFALGMVSLVRRALGGGCPFDVRRFPGGCGWWANGRFGKDCMWVPVNCDGDVWEEAALWLESNGLIGREGAGNVQA